MKESALPLGITLGSLVKEACLAVEEATLVQGQWGLFLDGEKRWTRSLNGVGRAWMGKGKTRGGQDRSWNLDWHV